MTEHQATFKEIESFMHILSDWVEETKSNLAAQDNQTKAVSPNPED